MLALAIAVEKQWYDQSLSNRKKTADLVLDIACLHEVKVWTFPMSTKRRNPFNDIRHLSVRERERERERKRERSWSRQNL